MSATRNDSVTYEAAEDAFNTLEQRISEESDPINLLDLIIHIDMLVGLLEAKIGKMQKRLIQ